MISECYSFSFIFKDLRRGGSVRGQFFHSFSTTPSIRGPLRLFSRM